MDKEQYIQAIIEMMNATDNMVMIDFIYKLLNKAA